MLYAPRPAAHEQVPRADQRQVRLGILRDELSRDSAAFFVVWRFFLRYLVPLAIAILVLAPLL